MPLDLESPLGDVAIEGSSMGGREFASAPEPARYLVDEEGQRLRDESARLLTVPRG